MLRLKPAGGGSLSPNVRGAYGQPVEDILHELDKSSCSWDDPGALLRWNGELTSERPVLNASADRTSRSVVLPSSAAKARQKIADKEPSTRIWGVSHAPTRNPLANRYF